jgi:hypothetical protein
MNVGVRSLREACALSLSIGAQREWVAFLLRRPERERKEEGRLGGLGDVHLEDVLAAIRRWSQERDEDRAIGLRDSMEEIQRGLVGEIRNDDR